MPKILLAFGKVVQIGKSPSAFADEKNHCSGILSIRSTNKTQKEKNRVKSHTNIKTEYWLGRVINFATRIVTG